MKVFGIWAKSQAMECSLKDQETILKDIGLMIKEKAKEVISITVKIKYLQENGQMISLNQEYILQLMILTSPFNKENNIIINNTFIQSSLLLNLQILLVFCKKRWKKSRSVEHSIELGLFLWMNSITKKNLMILLRSFRQLLKKIKV